MLSVQPVRVYQIGKMLRVADILYACGKDMAGKYGLQHWNNSRLKTWAVVGLCMLKNKVFLGVNEDGRTIATMQTKLQGDALHLAKLAVHPSASGKGYGSECLRWGEEYARAQKCKSVEFEVYDQSKHAIAFYEHCGYEACGSTETLKYREIKMKKIL